MIISLLWGNPNNIHPSITLLSSCISKPLIFCHQLNQWDQNCLTLSHFRKTWGRLSISLQKVHLLFSLIFMLCSHWLQEMILCIILHCNVWIFVSLTVIKDILKILFHIWGSALLKFGYCSDHFLTLIGVCFSELMNTNIYFLHVVVAIDFTLLFILIVLSIGKFLCSWEQCLVSFSMFFECMTEYVLDLRR